MTGVFLCAFRLLQQERLHLERVEPGKPLLNTPSVLSSSMQMFS